MNIVKLFFLALFMGSFIASAVNKEDEVQKVTLQLNWKHQFEFAGYYAAIEKGFYRDAGIKAELLEANEGQNPNDAVLEGKADFGISTSDVLLLRSKHKNVVVLASIFQYSPMVLLSLEKSKILHANDLIGKKIAIEPNSGEMVAYLNEEGVSINHCTIVPPTFDLKQLIDGDVDAFTASSTIEPFMLEEAGIPYSVLAPQMSGIDFYGDVLFTTTELITKSPDLVKKFREASLKGWQYALENQKELIDLIYGKYSQRHNIKFLIHESQHMNSLIMKDVVDIGYSDPERWRHILNIYQKINLVDKNQTIEGLLYSDYFGVPLHIPWNIVLPFLLIILVITSVSYVYYEKSRKLKIEIRSRIKMQHKLIESEELYRSLMATSPDTIIITDLDGTIRFVSPIVFKMFGYKESDVLNQHLLMYLTEQDKDRANKDISEMLMGNFSGEKEYNAFRADGSIFPIECKGEFFKNSLGEPTGIVFFLRDITSHKNSEGKILKAKRIYKFISQINQSIVLILEKNKLLQEFCRIAIDTGKFQMAWIGFIDESTRSVLPYAVDGLGQDYLRKIKEIYVGDDQQGRCPTGSAIREGNHFYCNDIENDPEMSLCRSEALEHGYRSSIAIPLKKERNVIGAITLYSSVPHFFDQEEIELLDEVADNISFALNTMDIDNEVKNLNANLEQIITERTAQLAETIQSLLKEIKERNRVELALNDSQQNYRAVVENIKEVIFYTDAQGLWLFLNQSWTEMTGFSLEESLGTSFLDYVYPEDRERNMALFMPLMRKEKEYCRHEIRYVTKEGGFRWVEVFARLKLNETGESVGTYGTLMDITDRKLARDFENELLQLSPKLTGISLTEINNALHLALERIGLFLGTDRATIFEFNDSHETFSNTFEWCNEGIKSNIDFLKDLSNASLPRLFEKLRQHENVLIPAVKDLPEGWQMEREILESAGIQSLIVIPMLSENNLIGFIGLDSILSHREYTTAEINILRVWSSMVASLINNQRSEVLLDQTRQNYETFFNTIDDFLWVFDEKGDIIHVNTTVRNRLGYTNEELKSQSIMMIHPPERREEAGRIVGEMLAGKADFCPVPVVSKSGIPISVETRVKAGFWNNQPVIFGISKDISKLELSEQKFSSAFQANAAMMSISNYENGLFIDVNNAFSEAIGYSREEIIGKSSHELGLFADAETRNEIKQALENNIPVVKKEVKTRIKDGSIRIGLLSADFIFVGNQRCLLIVNLDITERIKAEEEVKKARLEAEEANLAKSEFLSRMSHELRTPMNSILGFAQLLEMGDLNISQKKGVGYIIRSGKHLLDLINEVLDISRIEAGHISLSLEPILVNDIIHEMIEIFRQHANERKINLSIIESDDNFLYIKSDKQRLKQILLNLINNAIKYNNPGGSVLLKVGLMPENKSGIIPVRISVIDSGIGIAENDIYKLFNPFERIGAEKTTTEGTGLGLAVVKKLVDAMGGLSGIDSVEGEGSTFWIEFAQTDNRLQTSETHVRLDNLEQKLTDKNGLILYIEDNLSNVELVQEILINQRANIRLITDANGSKAVSLALEYKPGLILLDLNLPDIHGSVALQQLQANIETNSIPVVVISADAMPKQIEQLLKAGARKYVTKPLDLNVLLNIIDEYVVDSELNS